MTFLDLLPTSSCKHSLWTTPNVVSGTKHVFHKILPDFIITGITFGFPQDKSERIRECEDQNDCAELGFDGICCGNIHATGST